MRLDENPCTGVLFMPLNRRSWMQAVSFSALGGFLAQGGRAAAVPDSGTCRVIHDESEGSGGILLAGTESSAPILVDRADFQVVHIAADMLSRDIHRITGRGMRIIDRPIKASNLVIIGTLGKSKWVDRLVKNKAIDISGIANLWEASLWQTVSAPLPGIDRALVIVGSDRRGTAYGAMDLCELAGVSPWHWWADVPVKKAKMVAVTAGARRGGMPAVKYRGIFINDEDWTFKPWAAKTFDPELGNIGPKTYEKVFDLMLRLKLNYLWPAMHNCSTPFGAIPKNSVLANAYAIVMGSSHVEPMLANPASFLNGKNVGRNGPWNFVTNSKNIIKFWTNSVETRGKYEAIWTVGMRGPDDSPLEGVHTLAGERSLVERIFGIQRALLRRYVTRRWGGVAQCYVPYKEALLVYNSGLNVPRDVTIIWPDNNFGYVRQLSDMRQRQRPGGSGVYYHIEYFGSPHSYNWLNTTAPALVWEELKKAWDNDAREIWVINVGGIKPREVGIDFAARLAWNPEAFGPDAQEQFLHAFANSTCGKHAGSAVAALMRAYYGLGQIRRPESMSRQWAAQLSDAQAADLMRRYRQLMDDQKTIGALITADKHDAYFELFAYPAQMLAATGLIFLYDRRAGQANADRTENQRQVRHWRAFIEHQVWWYNNRLADGKWKYYATMGQTSWHSPWAQIRWPWIRSQANVPMPQANAAPLLTVNADRFKYNRGTSTAAWRRVDGLGWSVGAMVLWPAIPANQWNPETQLAQAPHMEYQITVPRACADGQVILRVLPTYKLYPGMQLRIAMRWNQGAAQVKSVPFASSETRVVGNAIRSAGVLDNHIPLHFEVGDITPGKHTLVIYAVDPGIVLDQIVVTGG